MTDSSRADLQSFEAVYNRFYVQVYRFFAKHLVSKELCEDLTNDVFYSCYKHFGRYDPAKATMATWLYSIANNRLKNYYRDKKDLVLADDSDVFVHLSDDSVDLEGAVFLSQMKPHLSAALESLTDRERAVVTLRYYSDLSSEAIAQEIGTTAGNVRVILSRTLRKIARYFEENEIRWE